MFGSTPNSQVQPLGWGASISPGGYGLAIPTVIGLTKTSPIQIWNGFLIQAPGGSKSGVQNYQKALDFLLGSNPIFGVLRLWEDQGARVGLNFVKYSQAIVANGVTSITVPDAHLYWVVAVTLEVPYSVSFNDYGAPGPVSLSGTYEIPLWNTSYAGSNPGNMGAYRFAPWTYSWTQTLGRVVQIPRNQFGAPWSGGTIHVYYAQLLSTVNPPYSTPLVQVRLFYEPTLGEGPEYGTAYAQQQIKYPHLAGMASTNFFLGSNFSTAPQIFPECIAAHSVWSTGDADFVDMVEDVFRSGFGQAGSTAAIGYGRTQRGLNTWNFPALIQKNLQGSAADDATSLAYPLQNTAGDLLVVVSYNNTTGPTDDGGNTWTLAYNWSAGHTSVWTATAKPWQPGNKVHVSGGSAGASLLGIFEVGGADTLDVIATNSGATGDSSVTATTTGQAGLPELLVGILGYGISAWKLDPGWNEEIAPANGIGVASRIVKTPGPYTFHTRFTAGSAPWFSGLLCFSNSGIPPYPNPFGDILDQPSFDLCRAQGRAYGLKGSISMDSQQKASDWLATFAQAGNFDYCWSGFKLKGVPRAEPSAVGNGSIYNSPYAAGPIYDITPDDLIGDASAPVVTFEGKAPVDIPTLLQVQYMNRDSDYATTVDSETDSGAAAIYGIRKPDSPVVLSCIKDSTTARAILAVMIQRRNLIDINAPIKFKAQAKLGLLEPGDLITISDPLLGVTKLPIKLTSKQEDESYNLDFEAEPYIYGANSPIPLNVTGAAPNVNDPNAPAAAINPPIIFEAVPGLGTINGMGALWLVVSSPGPNYGGCFVFVSTDGGASYNPIGTIQGNGTTGYTGGPLLWPASADPDAVNDLAVDLTESNGILSSYAVSDEDNFAYPCYVEPGAVGACVVKYELMTYALANLTATSKYTLKASGGGTNHLRRAVFGAPTPGTGVAHAPGSRFAFLSSPAVSNPPGILKLAIPANWYHQPIFFKFQPFNLAGRGTPTISTLTAHAFTPCAPVPITPPPVLPGATIEEVLVTAPAQPPTNFTIPHNLSAAPGLVLIEMTSDGEIWQTAPADGTNLHLAASAAGVTCVAICFISPTSHASVPFTASAPGTLTIPHGLGAKPKLVLIQMMSDGEIWQPTQADATNIYIDASASGISCNFIIWMAWPVETITVPPTSLATSTTITEIALAPSGPGIFTVAHNLGTVPILGPIRMTLDGEIWYQTARYDSTNLYLEASAAGVTGVAEIWS